MCPAFRPPTGYIPPPRTTGERPVLTFLPTIMKTSDALTGSLLRTYESIFRQPAAHNLTWHDIHILLDELGEVTEAHNGHVRVNRNGHILTVHLPHTQEVAEPALLLELRHFLLRSEQPPSTMHGAHWLLVIDHEESRLFRSELGGTVPQTIRPHSSHVHSQPKPDALRVRQQADPSGYFATVASALGGTSKILILGPGKGSGSAMEQFVTWAKHHHPALAARIIGTQVVDEHHVTEGQLLATARDFYAQVAPSLLR